MVLIDILGASKMRENKKNAIGKLLRNIFYEKWEDIFIYDAINSGKLSYGDFLKLAVSYAEFFERRGVSRGDIVCLKLSNSVDLAALYLANLIYRTCAVPIDPQKSNKEISDILSVLDYALMLKDEDAKPVKSSFYRDKKMDKDSADIFLEIDYSKLFLIAFTSGSTGKPKGVMHSFENLVLSAQALNRTFNFGEENVFYHNLPMTYMAGILNNIILPLISGSKIVISERFGISNVFRFWDYPIKYSVNTFWFIPAMISLLLRLDRSDRGVLYAKKNNIIGCVATAPLSGKAKDEFEKKYGILLYENYGLSETLFVSAGDIFDGVDISFDKDGEILIGVPWMFLGYHGADSAKFFKEGKFG
jgi:long-chain acyl-CoA synthetase